MKVLFINFKKNILQLIILAFPILLIIFSNSNIVAVKNGLSIWVNNLIPSLFPFFIAVNLLNFTKLPTYIGNLFNKIMRPLFNVPGIGAYALFMGIISGYPVGAKIVTDLRNNKLCTKEESERLLTFTNNSGPLFILGTVGISLYSDYSIGLLLLFTHILSCFTVAFLFRFWKSSKRPSNIDYSIHNSNNMSINNLGAILSNSIVNAVNSILLIGGFIVLFSVIISLLNKLRAFELLLAMFSPIFSSININTNFIIPLLSGIIELSYGIKLISLVHSTKLGINIIITAFLLGFGGISILLQVWGISSKSDISIKPYLIGKFLQGIFASFYTYLIIINFVFFKYLLF